VTIGRNRSINRSLFRQTRATPQRLSQLGNAREAVGKVTGDKDTEDKGKAEQATSSLKDAGETIKDAFKS
jgi:hypothetical protein